MQHDHLAVVPACAFIGPLPQRADGFMLFSLGFALCFLVAQAWVTTG